jgi:CPA2 family monovalent cation:H+ antiporter-2
MSHQAAADALPLRDAFAVLFFVSVGMLLDPTYLIANPLPVLAVLALIVIGKAISKLVIVLAAGYPPAVALTVAAGLAQIGEFSFIVGTVGRSLGLLPDEGYQLIVAGSLLSITINLARLRPEERETLRLHAIICGYGRVGRLIGPALMRRGFRYMVITQQRDEVDRLRSNGVTAIYGDAANPEVLGMAGISDARLAVVATSDPNETRLIVERVRALNPNLDIVARTHSDTEAAHLRALGGKVQAVHGERELAVQMARYALRRFGVSAAEAEAIAQGLRGRAVIVEEESGRGLPGALARFWTRISGRRG